MPIERLKIYANKNTTRGKFAAAAVHAALEHYGIEHGAVVVLGTSPTKIKDECMDIIIDDGQTEVEPGTITAGVRSNETVLTPEEEAEWKQSFDAAAGVT